MNCKVTPNNIRARSATDTAAAPHIMPPSIQTFQLDTRFIITRTVSTTLPHIRQTFAKTKTRHNKFRQISALIMLHSYYYALGTVLLTQAIL